MHILSLVNVETVSSPNSTFLEAVNQYFVDIFLLETDKVNFIGILGTIRVRNIKFFEPYNFFLGQRFCH